MSSGPAGGMVEVHIPVTIAHLPTDIQALLSQQSCLWTENFSLSQND